MEAMSSSLFDDDERALRGPARSFMGAHVGPLAADHNGVRSCSVKAAPQPNEFGCVSGAVPHQHCGDEQTTVMEAILMEEAERCQGSLRTHRERAERVPLVLVAGGTAEQRDQFLKPMLGGRRFGWSGLTEADTAPSPQRCCPLSWELLGVFVLR
jgi:alkylation response protein AidB-like acyl-CoA dehydrogenase